MNNLPSENYKPECLFTVEVYIENYQSVKWEEDLNLIQISDKTKPK